ncbi:MAG: hypothetical protein ACR2P0_17540 [Acidimicrobiales bacterium]
MNEAVRVLVAGLIVIGFSFGSVLAAAAQVPEALEVAIEPVDASVVLGEMLEVDVRVTNTGSVATVPLVVHLDITDLSADGSVDPEDWTSTLSVPIGSVPPSATIATPWTLQPIAGGDFTVYAVVLAAELDSVETSQVLRVNVVDQRSLNPGGILPVAIGMPAIVGGLLVGQIGRGRRSRRAAR